MLAIAIALVMLVTSALGQAEPIVTPPWQTYQHAKLVQEAFTVTSHSDKASSARGVIRVANVNAGRILRLELGRLVIVCEGSTLRAVHTLNPHIMLEREIEQGAWSTRLQQVLPPVLVPQIAWALGEVDTNAHGCTSIVPGVGEVQWTMSPAGAIAGTPARSLRAMHAKAQGGLLTQLSGELAGRNGVIGFDVTFQEASPLEVGKWSIEPGSRLRVDSIKALREAEGAARPGEVLAPLALMKSDVSGISISQLFTPETQHAVLVLFAANDIAAQRDAHGIALALQRSLRDQSKGPKPVLRAVGVLEVGDVSPRALQQGVEDWERLDRPAGQPAPLVLWTSLGASGLEHIAPGHSVACVIVDAQQHIVAIVPVHTESDVVRDEVLAHLPQ